MHDHSNHLVSNVDLLARAARNLRERAADTAAIVNAIVTLGRGLGIKVTAEGVETAGQRLFLRAAGVHSMQGYHIGRPCPAEYIAAKLGSPPPPQVSHDRTDLAQAS